MVNVVVAPQVYVQYRESIHSTFVIVDGVVQKDHGAVNVVVTQVTSICSYITRCASPMATSGIQEPHLPVLRLWVDLPI